MLNLFPHRSPNCESHGRREFLVQVGFLGGVGLSLDMLLRAQAARADAGKAPANDTNCILIWTRGGTNHAITTRWTPSPKPKLRSAAILA